MGECTKGKGEHQWGGEAKPDVSITLVSSTKVNGSFSSLGLIQNRYKLMWIIFTGFTQQDNLRSLNTICKTVYTCDDVCRLS